MIPVANGIISAAAYGVITAFTNSYCIRFFSTTIKCSWVQTHSNLAPADLSQIGVTDGKMLSPTLGFSIAILTPLRAQLCAVSLLLDQSQKKTFPGEHDLLHY